MRPYLLILPLNRFVRITSFSELTFGIILVLILYSLTQASMSVAPSAASGTTGKSVVPPSKAQIHNELNPEAPLGLSLRCSSDCCS